jgi:hypothetical protein
LYLLDRIRPDLLNAATYVAALVKLLAGGWASGLGSNPRSAREYLGVEDGSFLWFRVSVEMNVESGKTRSKRMRRAKRRVWFPLARLGAFFISVVIIGNVFLQAFRIPVTSVPQDPQKSESSFPGKMKRLEKRIFRLLERIIDTPASACSTEQESTGAKVPVPIENKLSMSRTSRTLLLAPAIDNLSIEECTNIPFAWPVPLTLCLEPESFPPAALRVFEGPNFRATLVTDVYRHCSRDPAGDVGDALLEGPMMLFDGFFTCTSRLSGRSAVRTWEDEEDRSVTARLLDIKSGERKERLFTVFMQLWTERENKYLGAFDESRADTAGFRNRTEGADLGELEADQRKIIWDVLRRTYLAQYKMGSEEQVREEAWYFGRWTGMDFAVLPPFIVAYLYYRGLDKKIRMGEMGLRVFFEPVSEFVHWNHDRSVATALEWTVKGFPVGVIISAGHYDGRYGLDFVGIGTSIAAAREGVNLQHEGPPR